MYVTSGNIPCGQGDIIMVYKGIPIGHGGNLHRNSLRADKMKGIFTIQWIRYSNGTSLEALPLTVDPKVPYGPYHKQPT